MMGHSGAGDDVAPPPATLEFDDAKPSAGAWAVGGGSGSGGSGNDDPGVRSLVDLIELLHASENPLWDLIRFEVRHRDVLTYWLGSCCVYFRRGARYRTYVLFDESKLHPLLGQVTLRELMEETLAYPTAAVGLACWRRSCCLSRVECTQYHSATTVLLCRLYGSSSALLLSSAVRSQ